MSEIKLKSCPFCGVELHKHHRYYHHEINGCLFDDYEFFEEDFEKWNTRKPMQEIVKNLEAELLVASLEVELCASDNSLEIDSAKGYANGVASAIEIVKEVGGMNETQKIH